MIGKLFGKKKKEPTNTDKSLQTLQNLNGQIDVLEKKSIIVTSKFKD